MYNCAKCGARSFYFPFFVFDRPVCNKCYFECKKAELVWMNRTGARYEDVEKRKQFYRDWYEGLA